MLCLPWGTFPSVLNFAIWRLIAWAADATFGHGPIDALHFGPAHFGTLTPDAESWPGAYGLMSSTGVPSKASIFSTSTTLSLTARRSCTGSGQSGSAEPAHGRRTRR